MQYEEVCWLRDGMRMCLRHLSYKVANAMFATKPLQVDTRYQMCRCGYVRWMHIN